jgi:GNAT superfamily N-acetyltransferase
VSAPCDGVVRRAEEGDAAQVFEIARGMATSFAPSYPTCQASLRALVGQHDAQLLVVENASGGIDAYLLGFVHLAFYADGPVAWVEEVAVRPERRRQGLGRALAAAFEEWARAREARLVALATRRAGDFYAALGYEESAVYFRKILPG